MNALPFFLIVSSLAAAFVLPLLDLLSPRIRKVFLLCMMALQVSLLTSLWVGWRQFPLEYLVGGWDRGVGISLYVDGFGAIMITLVSFLAIMSTIYSLNRIAHNQGKYYVLLSLLTAGLTGAMATGDLFNLYVFTELVSITSYSLVAFERRVAALEAALKYLLYGALSGVLYLLAVVLVYFSTGSLNMLVVAERIGQVPPSILATITGLFLVAFMVKMGLVPFHTWLSDAHAAAPSPVSALLSGLVIKLGAYSLVRVFFFVYGAELAAQLGVFRILLFVGMLTVLVGHSMAAVQTESKRLLAYSSIAQMGYIAMAIGTGSHLAIGVVVIYVVSHAMVKAGLFLSLGSLTHEAGSREISALRGAVYKWPLPAVLFSTMALAIIGVPPLVGFAAKWFLSLGLASLRHLVPLLIFVIGTGISVFYYLQLVFAVFGSREAGRSPDPEFTAEGKLTFAAHLPVVVLMAAAVAAGMVPFALEWDLAKLLSFLMT